MRGAVKRITAMLVAIAYLSVTLRPAAAGAFFQGSSSPATAGVAAVVSSARVVPVSIPTPQPRGLATRVAAFVRRPSYFITPPKVPVVVDWRHAARDPRALAAVATHPIAAHLRSVGLRRYDAASFRAAPKLVSAGTESPAGEKPWWQFQNAPVPGIGSAAVNVSNGNLVVRADDMEIAHKGIPFSFVRTFNSMSRHDAAGSDGSQPSVFGNGWTNNFDAHIATNDLGGISVYGPDGARYDFTPTTAPGYPTGWIPPAGIFDQLSVNADGTYDVTDTGGTIMRFYPPSGAKCPTPAVCGRLQFLIGRNHYTSLSFTYGFGQPSEIMSSMSQIKVTGEDGEAATLNLSPSAVGPLLSQLVWPAGQVVTYGYDSSGNLNAVDQVGNNNSWIPQSYGYTGTQLSYVTDPRFSNSSNPGPCGDGNYEQFNYDSAGRIASVQANGEVNTTPSDGTATLLQPSAPQGCVQFLQLNWSYASGLTSFNDTNGHKTTFAFDALGRVTATTPLGGTGTPQATVAWNSSNEVIAQTDINKYQYNLAYDANGNHIALSAPPTSTSSGKVNPTWTASYDADSNLLAVCDPNWNAAHGTSWSGSGSPPVCKAQAGVPQATWTSTTYEPYGELTLLTTSRGYARTIGYSATNQSGGDYGLPTSIVGASITEADGTVLKPTESFTYDAHGNQLAYNFGPGAWYFTFDSSNRILTTRDPDGFLGYTSWFPNGDQASRESTYQHALETKTPGTGAVRKTYDPDRNLTAVTHHYGFVSGTTSYWYDAADRMVEAEEPVDPADHVQTPFLARYLYDNSQDGTQTITSANASVRFAAHGNYYATQFYLPPATYPQAPGWQFYSGYAYDAYDRPTARYTIEPSSAATRPWRSATWTYGSAVPNLNVLSATTNELGSMTTYAFTPLAQLSAVTYGDGSPAESYVYDPDGQTRTATKGDVGTEDYTYDSDGNLLTQAEPATGLTSSATYTFGTYLDGIPSSLSVNSAALKVTNLFQYVHRVDGLATKELVAYAADGRSKQTFTWGYSPAGRLNANSDDERSSSLQYDINGLPEIDNLPKATLGYAFDPEGLLTSELFADDTGNVTLQYSVNDRGESVGTQTGTSITSVDHPFAGMLYADPKNTFDSPTAVNFDPIDSAKLSESVNSATEYATLASIATNWSYDAAGRTVSQAETISNNSSLPGSNLISYTYDGTDRMVQTSCAFDTSVCPHGTVKYQYDTQGNVVSASGDQARSFAPYSGGKETLHWANGQFLFSTNDAGQIDDLKIGTSADITLKTDAGQTATNLTYWDRDVTGNEVSWHAAGQVGATVLPGDPIRGYPAVPTTASMRGLFYFAQARVDGYSDGVNVFQGNRVSNSRLGAWMTRDQSLGRFANPLSLKPYVFNGNNSISNVDPSGNFPIPFDGGGLTIGEAAATDGLDVIADILGIIDLFEAFFGLFGGGDHRAPPIPHSPNVAVTGLIAQAVPPEEVEQLEQELEPEIDQALRTIWNAVSKGKFGERAAGIGNVAKRGIRIGARMRFPDELTRRALTEAKNVKYQHLSSQLKDYLQYVKENGLQFNLAVRERLPDGSPGTTLSGPLEDLVKEGLINLQETIPPGGNF